MRKEWTDEETATLRDLLAGGTYWREICAIMRRSRITLQKAAARLGLPEMPKPKRGTRTVFSIERCACIRIGLAAGKSLDAILVEVNEFDGPPINGTQLYKKVLNNPDWLLKPKPVPVPVPVVCAVPKLPTVRYPVPVTGFSMLGGRVR